MLGIRIRKVIAQYFLRIFELYFWLIISYETPIFGKANTTITKSVAIYLKTILL
jgi:hypothetical protein